MKRGEGLPTQYVLYGLLAVFEVVLFALLVGLIRQGQRWSASVAAATISPGLLSVMVLLEGRSLAEVADLATLPWSLAIGDLIIIPAAAWVAAHGYRTWNPLPARPVHFLPVSWVGWIILWWAVGLVVGALFYFVLDGPNYEAAGMLLALLSPTKITHDFVVMPALWGGMWCAGLPLLGRKTFHRWVLVACFVGWATLVMVDGQRGLDLTQLHPLWDAAGFRPIP